MPKKTKWVKLGIIFVLMSLITVMTIADDLPVASVGTNVLINPSMSSWTGWEKKWWPSGAGILNLEGFHGMEPGYSTRGMYMYSVYTIGESQAWLDSTIIPWGANKIGLASIWYLAMYTYNRYAVYYPNLTGGELFLEVEYLSSGGLVLDRHRTVIDQSYITSATNLWRQLSIVTLPSPPGTTQARFLVGLDKGFTDLATRMILTVDVAFLGEAELIIPPKKYVVYSETTSGEEYYVFDTTGGLWIENPNLEITNTSNAYEGSSAFELTAQSNKWFSMGLDINTNTGSKDLSDYSYGGSLNLALKTSSSEHFKIGLKNGTNESWINFVSDGTPYGFSRNGTWQMVQIPISHFAGLGDMKNMNQMLMISGNAPETTFTMSIDDIYFNSVSTNAANHKAQMITPVPGSILGITGTAFRWTRGIGVTEYIISIGTSVGATNIYDQSTDVDTIAFITSIPKNGQTIYVRLWSKIDGAWEYNDYTYGTSTLGQPHKYIIYSE
ncbi:MAG: hypothetical protein KAS64_08865, partial [Spirochaetes bacterium]|nr:hypothetical protein [Spirochaetota bacterium]